MKFPVDTFKQSLEMLLNLSDRAMEPYVREKIQEFIAIAHTPRELYDFMDWISKLPCERIEGSKICVGDIDGFIQSVCDVTKYYERPEV